MFRNAALGIRVGRGAGLITVCALLVHAPAALAETSNKLKDVLALAGEGARQQVYFTDLGAAGSFTGERGGALVRRLGRRLIVPGVTTALGHEVAQPGSWQRATGFGLEQVDGLAVFGTPPRQAMVYVLAASPPAPAALEAAWAERGYRRIAAAGVTMWGRGEPLKMDFTRRDPADPFGGELGRSSFLFALPPLLVEAGDPAVLEAAAKGRASGGLAARADVAALLRMLDQTYADARLINALLFADTEPFHAADGITRYSAFLVADLERGDSAETALLLAFPDCARARGSSRDRAALAHGRGRPPRDRAGLDVRPAGRALRVARPRPARRGRRGTRFRQPSVHPHRLRDLPARTPAALHPAAIKHSQMAIEWDQQKADLNYRKHRVSFEEAVAALEDNLSKVLPDQIILTTKRASSRLRCLRADGCW